MILEPRIAQPGGARTRQAGMKPPRSNPEGVAQQSPGLARRQPWVIARQCPSTPTGLRPGGRKTGRLRCPPATTPLGLTAPPSPLPRVVPSVQPWALLHNRVAVGWSLDILHANGVRAHQPRATPWETSLQWHSPPCKGGRSSRGLRPFRAPECSEGPAFPGCYPGLIC
jgi:hypothetical protein